MIPVPITPSRPMCAICGKPVERLDCSYSVHLMRWIFTAYCHGSQEQCRVSVREFELINGIFPGTAFQKAAATGIEPVRTDHTPHRVPICLDPDTAIPAEVQELR